MTTEMTYFAYGVVSASLIVFIVFIAVFAFGSWVKRNFVSNESWHNDTNVSENYMAHEMERIDNEMERIREDQDKALQELDRCVNTMIDRLDNRLTSIEEKHQTYSSVKHEVE